MSPDSPSRGLLRWPWETPSAVLTALLPAALTVAALLAASTAPPAPPPVTAVAPGAAWRLPRDAEFLPAAGISAPAGRYLPGVTVNGRTLPRRGQGAVTWAMTRVSVPSGSGEYASTASTRRVR